KTTLRQCSRIVLAMLVMTGRVTMLGLSRWAGTGGSYRTIQRFFATALPWATLFWVFFRHHIYQAAEVYLLVGDEVVATQPGKHSGKTHLWTGSVLCESLWQAGARAGFLHPGTRKCPGTARVSPARRARRAQRRRESRQQGQGGIKEGQSAVRTAAAWASKGQ